MDNCLRTLLPRPLHRFSLPSRIYVLRDLERVSTDYKHVWNMLKGRSATNPFGFRASGKGWWITRRSRGEKYGYRVSRNLNYKLERIPSTSRYKQDQTPAGWKVSKGGAVP